MDKNTIWIDENENDLGEVSVSKAHQEGLLHRISVVYLTNDRSQILIQIRDDGRIDHSAAGHVDVGESYQEAAKRELEEELGVRGVELTEIGDCSSEEDRGKTRHKFRVFQCKANPDKPNPDEVKEVFWADPREIWNDMKGDDGDKKYCGGFRSTLELFLRELQNPLEKI